MGRHNESIIHRWENADRTGNEWTDCFLGTDGAGIQSVSNNVIAEGGDDNGRGRGCAIWRAFGEGKRDGGLLVYVQRTVS